MKTLSLLFAFCIIAKSAFNQNELISKQEEAAELHDLGFYSLLSKDYEKAIDYFTKSIKTDSLLIGNYLDRGTAYKEIGQYTMAENDFKKVINLKSDFTFQAYNNLGLLYKKQNKYEKALSQFNSAISLKSDCFECYFNRAQTNETFYKTNEAISDYTSAIKIKSDYSNAYFNRGTLKYSIDDLTGAIKDYSEALKYNPNNIEEIRYNRGMCYTQLKQYDKGKSDFEFYISKDKTNADSYYNLAVCCYYLNKLPEACSYAKKSLSLGKKDSQALINASCK